MFVCFIVSIKLLTFLGLTDEYINISRRRRRREEAFIGANLSGCVGCNCWTVIIIKSEIENAIKTRFD